MRLPRAVNLLRAALHYRREAFDAGLTASGFDLVRHIDRPAHGDLLVIWNRYAGYNDIARHFEAHGARVLVVENGALGKTWRGGEWFALALDAVAMTGGRFNDCGPQRWDAWGVDLEPWRDPGGECVVLGQRGIGSPSVASPTGWAETTRDKQGGRVRPHPGKAAGKPLREDLARAGEVITWSSAGAVQALTMGVPVWHAHPAFVMAGACRPLAERGKVPARRDDESRLAAFRRLAWCMWTMDEIRTGEPIRCLLA